jgi:hypothetical protein
MNSTPETNITPEDPQNQQNMQDQQDQQGKQDQQDTQDQQQNQQPNQPASTNLQLHPAALHGVAGRIVRLLAHHTEAHPAAILLQLLASFGNLIGPGPHCMVESTRHALNLFIVLVGDSSKARKGTSWNLIANLFEGVDPLWLQTCVNSSRLTAAGLLQALRDQDPPTERRLLALSEEFATVLYNVRRGNGHLSPLLRCAWDSGNLPTLDLDRSLRVTAAHFSLIAHVTQQELTRNFRHEQAHNGFANRCLWTWVQRAQCLPEGGSPPAHDLAVAAGELRRAAVWATARPAILFRRDQEAAAMWARYYANYSYGQPSLHGTATSRAEAQILRLSALYAALDSSELIRPPHLEAAFAVWQYCYESATHLFGLCSGDSIADRIREAVEASYDGLSKTQIIRLFQGHVELDRIDSALQQLASLGALHRYSQPTNGRHAIRWSSAAALRQVLAEAE